MKIIYQNAKVVATATDAYDGPESFVDAPGDFDVSRMGEYVVTDGIAAIPAPDPRESAKAARTAAVAAIKVTTQAGHTFDGDETSQGRMSRAIIALSTGLAPSVSWVLADNSVIQASEAELTEALVLAGQAQAALWVIA